MLTAAGCQSRRQRLWSALDPHPDWIIVTDPPNLAYLANYVASPFVFRTIHSAAVLLLRSDGSSVLIGDNMLKAFAEKAHVNERLLPAWYEGKRSAGDRGELLLRTVLDRLQGCPGRRIGIEPSRTPTGVVEWLRRERPGLELVPINGVLRDLRRRKDADELDCLRRSVRAIDAGHAAALAGVKPGMTELDYYLLVQQAAIRAAGDQAMVYGDFVSGPRTWAKGGPPSDRVIQQGELVLLDFSVVIDGYRGDTANTFVCGAAPSDEQRRLHAACLEALAVAESLVRAGTPCRKIDRAARESFAAQGLAGHFISHCGHGLGLGHPEPPFIVPESDDTLVAGDVIAIEPGQYIQGVGGMRFEHNYLVTEDGYEVLSRHELRLDQPSC